MKRNSEVLQATLNKAMKSGEVPYQAFMRALKRVDVEDNIVGGNKELGLTISGLGVFERDLGALANAAKSAIRGITASVT